MTSLSSQHRLPEQFCLLGISTKPRGQVHVAALFVNSLQQPAFTESQVTNASTQKVKTHRILNVAYI
jgi:hypothetical protein